MISTFNNLPQRHEDTGGHGASQKQKLTRGELKNKELTERTDYFDFQLFFSCLPPCLRVSVVEGKILEGSHV
jgi:hypothetical protein